MKKQRFFSILLTTFLVSPCGAMDSECSWDQTPQEAYMAYAKLHPYIKDSVESYTKPTVIKKTKEVPIKQQPKASPGFWSIFSVSKKVPENRVEIIEEEIIQEGKKLNFEVEEENFKRFEGSYLSEHPRTMYQKMTLQDFTCDGTITFSKDTISNLVGLGLTEYMEETSGIKSRTIIPTEFKDSNHRSYTYYEYLLKANDYPVRKNLRNKIEKTEKFALYLSSAKQNELLQVSFKNMRGNWFITGMREGSKILDFSQSPHLKIWLNMPWIKDKDQLKGLEMVLRSMGRKYKNVPLDILKVIYFHVIAPSSPKELGFI